MSVNGTTAYLEKLKKQITIQHILPLKEDCQVIQRGLFDL